MAPTNFLYLSLKEIRRIIATSNKTKAKLERIQFYTSRSFTHFFNHLTNLFTRNDWEILEAKLLQNKEAYMRSIGKQFYDANGVEKIVLIGTKLLLDHLKDSETSLRKEFLTNLREHEKLCLELIDELGETACNTLYVKLCSQMVAGPHSSVYGTEVEDGDALCEKYRREIYNSLRNANFKRVLYLGNELCLLGEIMASYHASEIYSYQEFRRTDVGVEQKYSSLEEELKKVKLMKDRILDYAIGLYFNSASPKVLKRESKYSSKLQYKSKDVEPESVLIEDLLESPDSYFDKNVRVRGLVSSITQKKWRVRGKEAVRTEFDITHGSHRIPVYRHGFILRDNGLEENGLIELRGLFFMDTKKNRYMIKASGYNFRADRNEDWLSRCRWLVSKWWNGGTDNTMCEWTLSGLQPSILPKFNLSFINVTSSEGEEALSVFRELRRNFPPIRSAVRVSSRTLSKAERDEFDREIERIQTRSLAIDRLISIICNSEREVN